MSALAEALLAAQRQAVAQVSKSYVAGAMDQETMLGLLDGIGLRDAVEQGLLLASLEVVKTLGGEAPAPAGQVAPLDFEIHVLVQLREPEACRALCASLTDAEYAYAVTKLGEAVFERVYGIEYGR